MSQADRIQRSNDKGADALTSPWQKIDRDKREVFLALSLHPATCEAALYLGDFAVMERVKPETMVTLILDLADYWKREGFRRDGAILGRSYHGC